MILARDVCISGFPKADQGSGKQYALMKIQNGWSLIDAGNGYVLLSSLEIIVCTHLDTCMV